MRNQIFSYIAKGAFLVFIIVCIGLLVVVTLPNNELDHPPPQDDTIYYGTPIWNETNDTSPFTALESVVINNISYILDGYVWRDFMPFYPDTRLRVAVSIEANTSFPLSIDYDILWVRKGSEIYNATFYSGYRLENQFNKGTYGGPEWKEGSIVDIAVRMICETNETYFLKSENHTLVYTY